MFYEDPHRPYIHHVVTPRPGASMPGGRPARRPEPVPFDAPAGTLDAVGAPVWDAVAEARFRSKGVAAGLQTGHELLDATFGGFRAGRTYLVQSPGTEALEAGRCLIAAAQRCGANGSLWDPETVMRNAVAERTDASAGWQVRRPHTIPALCSVEPVDAVDLQVLALPARFAARAGKRDQARLMRWLAELQARTRETRRILVILIPWSGPSLPRALEALARRVAAVGRLERTVDGGMVARNVRDGRARAYGPDGRPDRQRERRLHQGLLPWGAAPAS